MKRRRSFRGYRLIQAAVFSLLPLAACSGDKSPRKGQIMLAVQTDMSIPDDVSHVRIVVQKNGALMFDKTYQVGPNQQQIPATLGLIASDDPEDTVEVSVVGYQRGTARTLSRAVTTIPQDRIATLHVPIQWLCWNQVSSSGGGVAETVDSSCENPDEACVAGDCEDTRIDSATLPDYRLEDIQGGGEEPSEGICLDTAPCFDIGRAIVPGPNCTLNVTPAELARLNVALTLAPETRGICSEETDRCYVPLDRDERYGWRVLDGAPGAGGAAGAGGSSSGASGGSGGESDGAGAPGAAGSSEGGGSAEGGAPGEPSAPFPGSVTIQLPNAVCERIREGEALGLHMTSACTTKTPSIPTCGPWTEIGRGNPATMPRPLGPGPMMPPNSECPALFMGMPAGPIAADPEIDRFARLSLELYQNADRVRSNVGESCTSINARLGQGPTRFASDVPTDEELSAACDAAVQNLGSESQLYTLSFGRGHCRVDTTAQLSEEDDCAELASCDLGTFGERCSSPLSSCDGTCQGQCLPSGNDLSVDCDGFCRGQCEGSCDGSCTGPGGNPLPAEDCRGECSGTCLGTCQGECSTTEACSGDCSGDCEGTATDEGCEHPLSLPQCASSSACAHFAATVAGLRQICSAPSVLVTSQTPPNIAPAISENYPRLLMASTESQALSIAIGALGTAGSALLMQSGASQGPDAACLAESFQVYSDAANRLATAWTQASLVIAGQSGTPPIGNVCTPDASDDACGICVKGACCTQLVNCTGDALCEIEASCLRECVGEGGSRTSCIEVCAQSGGVLNPRSQSVLDCLLPSCGTTCADTACADVVCEPGQVCRSGVCEDGPAPSCVTLGPDVLIDDFEDNDTISIHGPWRITPGTNGNHLLVAGAASEIALSASGGPGPGLTLEPLSCLDASASTALSFMAQDLDRIPTVLELRIRTRQTEPPALGGDCVAPNCGDYHRASATLVFGQWTPYSISFTSFLNSRRQPVNPAEILGIDFVSNATSVDNFALDDVSLGPIPVGAAAF